MEQKDLAKFTDMMDEELQPSNEQSQANVPPPDSLMQKIPINKKEVTIADKFSFGLGSEASLSQSLQINRNLKTTNSSKNLADQLKLEQAISTEKCHTEQDTS